MYLDHTFARKTFAQRYHFTFWLKKVLRPNFRSANCLSESWVKKWSRPLSQCPWDWQRRLSMGLALLESVISIQHLC